MNSRRTQRRGVVLVLAVLLMGIVAGLLSVLAVHATRIHQQRQADRVRATVRAMSDSAVAYARLHVVSNPGNLPGEPVALDVTALLSPEMTGSAVLTFHTDEGRGLCRITAQAALGGRHFQSTTDLQLPAQTAALSIRR
jgi:FlaG/FlaF family flagellin (archaellin)